MAIGLGLVALALASPVQANHPAPGLPDPVDDSQLTKQYCEEPDNFEHITPRQQAICGSGGVNPKSSTSISNLVQRIVSILAWVAGVAAIVVMVVQGLRMILSGGDSSALANARNGIIYAIVGLAIAVTAPHLVGYILSIVGD